MVKETQQLRRFADKSSYSSGFFFEEILDTIINLIEVGQVT